MVGLKEKAGVLPEVELDNYSSVLSGVARIDVDPSSGTVRVVPTVVVDSCLGVPDGALPEYRPTEIVYEGRRYILREPLDCEVTWDSEYSCYWIRCPWLDLRTTGLTLEEAVECLSAEFDYVYERYNELSDPDQVSGLRLGVRLGLIGSRVVSLIKEIL
jgi:hypothetical protein